MSCRIVDTSHMSCSFEGKSEVSQDCPLSPFLFLKDIERIMKTSTADRNNSIQWRLWMQLGDLDFADDLALLSKNYSQMQDASLD
jgi:hypothetical protein